MGSMSLAGFRRLLLWTSARRALRRGAPDRALDILSRLESAQGGLEKEQEALLATALLRCGRYDSARARFAQLKARLREDEDDDARYVAKYCLCYLALIRDDRSQAAYEARSAAGLNCRGALRKALSMPHVSQRPKLGTAITQTI